MTREWSDALVMSMFGAFLMGILVYQANVSRRQGFDDGYAAAKRDERYVPDRMAVFGFCPTYRPMADDERLSGCK